MSEKLYRIRASTALDQDIIGFLESIPTTRRSELLRHILRYYSSQLKNDGELFLIAEAPYHSIVHFTYHPSSNEKEIKEYKLRLDEKIDHQLIETLEKVPRRRRSEFWRNVLRYYMNHLGEGEIFIMPMEVVNQVTERPVKSTLQETNEIREDPGDELNAFDLDF